MATTDRVEGTLGYPKLIGLCGQAGAGKDLVAALLRMKGYTRYGFADEVRKEVKHAIDNNDFPKMPELIFSYYLGIEDPWEKPCPIGTRAVLQWWGTEYRRAQIPTYWIDKLAYKMNYESNYFVISDVRFQNEADWIKKAGGEIWYVNRHGLPTHDHSSEQEYKQIKFSNLIDNNGDLQHLAAEVLKALEISRA